MSTNDDRWSDFTHTTQTSRIGSHELFERYLEFNGLIKKITRKELVTRGWLKSIDDDTSLATIFFNLPLSEQPTLFRKSDNAKEDLLALWQTRARNEAECRYFSEERREYKGLSKEALRSLAQMSVNPKVVRDLPSILARAGIILVYVNALPGMKADGALFPLSTGTPVIAMSLRYSRLDYFWFTLLHELAHLVLHADKLTEAEFYDADESEQSEHIEKNANRLAKDSIVDRESWRSCAPKYDPDSKAVITYAKEQGVHPSLVAGLLRRESGNYKRYSSIINEYDVREIIFSHD